LPWLSEEIAVKSTGLIWTATVLASSVIEFRVFRTIPIMGLEAIPGLRISKSKKEYKYMKTYLYPQHEGWKWPFRR
jgi:hypothetical protein